MKLSTPDAEMPEINVDPAIFFDRPAITSNETLVHDLQRVLKDNGIISDSMQQKALMAALLPLIVKRDDVVYNYAYKAGRASV